MGAIAIGLVLLAGAAVGATSIGGVLVVPVLTVWTATPLGGAIAASSCAFAFTGAAAFAWPAAGGRRRSAGASGRSAAGSAGQATGEAAFAKAAPPDAESGGRPPAGLGGWPLHGCALLGAALGAATLGWLPAGGVRTGIGLLAVATGIHGLWRLHAGGGGRAAAANGNGVATRRATGLAEPQTGTGAASTSPREARRAELGRGQLAAIGLGVGCASAWSGTGGPVLLLPLLAWVGWRTDRAVAAAQRIQLPVALAATVVHLGAGRLDLRLGLLVGALVLAGWTAGRWLGGRMTTRRLAQAVALAMIGVGVWYLR